MKEKEEEVNALIEKQALAVEEASERLKAVHEQEMRKLVEKHQQEVGFANYKCSLQVLTMGVPAFQCFLLNNCLGF